LDSAVRGRAASPLIARIHRNRPEQNRSQTVTLLNRGHFMLETHVDEIALAIEGFLSRID
jgi:hypothetical protein